MAVEQTQQSYKVKLEIFDGPLDLLLYLIRKEEINIYEIPIAYIVRQYLDYVEFIKFVDLETAGDFLVMATTLMNIKARTLLPSSGRDDEDLEDPRQELVERLLEYEQYKKIVDWLEDKETTQKQVFSRPTPPVEKKGERELLFPVNLFELITAFKKVTGAQPPPKYHNVRPSEVSVEEQTEFVLNILKGKEQLAFIELIAKVPKVIAVVRFIVILNLVKEGKIAVRQSSLEGEIWIYLKAFFA